MCAISSILYAAKRSLSTPVGSRAPSSNASYRAAYWSNSGRLSIVARRRGNAPNDKLRLAVEFEVGAAQIFAEQPDTDELHTTHEKDRCDQRSPPRRNCRIAELGDNDIADQAEARQADQRPKQRHGA